MNHLKRLYVMIYIAFAMGLLINSLAAIVQGVTSTAWYGVALTVLPINLMLMGAMLTRRMARTGANLDLMIMAGLVGLILAASGVVIGGEAVHVLALAGAGFVGLLFYVFWYSRFGRTPSPHLETGSPLPEFDLINVEGERVPVSSLTADRPVIFTFIRGNWCPICMGQVNEMTAGLAPFVTAGIDIVFIASQDVVRTRALAKGRPDGIRFYADPDNAAARTLEIQNPAGLPLGMEILGYRSETALPTTIITRAGGEIAWTDQTDNYRVRPKPQTLLAMARQAGWILLIREEGVCDSSIPR